MPHQDCFGDVLRQKPWVFDQPHHQGNWENLLYKLFRSYKFNYYARTQVTFETDLDSMERRKVELQIVDKVEEIERFEPYGITAASTTSGWD